MGPVEVFVDTSAIVASGDDFRLGSREFRLIISGTTGVFGHVCTGPEDLSGPVLGSASRYLAITLLSTRRSTLRVWRNQQLSRTGIWVDSGTLAYLL